MTTTLPDALTLHPDEQQLLRQHYQRTHPQQATLQPPDPRQKTESASPSASSNRSTPAASNVASPVPDKGGSPSPSGKLGGGSVGAEGVAAQQTQQQQGQGAGGGEQGPRWREWMKGVRVPLLGRN